ncbi:MAG: hypothetical protein D6759_05435 [Chloroflexi bacterium]|nr:MAG: hypothetical protein D6759_05435 [Chloroflexota bacterium]
MGTIGWRPTEGQIVKGSLGLALFLYLVLLVAVLPPHTFFDSDPGVKFLQVRNLVAHRWQGLWVDDPGEALDPSHTFSPFNTSFFYRDGESGRVYGVYSVPFVVLTSLFYALLGFRGLYLLPALATLGTMIVTYRLSRPIAPRTAPLAPLLVGVLSPMLFYSVDLWEHTPAVFLAILGLWGLVETLARGRARWLLGAGLVLGLAAWFRAEVYALILACGLTLLWVERRRPRRLLVYGLAYGAGLALVLLPIGVFQEWSFGSPLGPHLQNAVVPQVNGQVARKVNMHPLALWALKSVVATKLLVPWTTSKSWTVLVAGLVLLRLLAGRIPAWRRGLTLLLAGAASLGTMGVVLMGVWEHWFARNLVQSFPVLLFLLFLGLAPEAQAAPVATASEERHSRMRLLALVGGLFTAFVLLTTPSSGGPQWGARFLMPVYPLLVVGVLYALEPVLASRPRRPMESWALLFTFVFLCGASALTQFEGLRRLYWSKADYAQLTQAIERLAPEVVVTDTWWMPVVTAAASEPKTWFLVNHGRNGGLADLVAVLRERGVTQFAYVTTPGGPLPSSSELPAGYLAEQARHTE